MSFSMSTSVFQAISFLVRPLALTQAVVLINTVQLVLRSTLTAAALEAPNQKLILTFTSTSPPRAVLSACIAVGIHWAEWFEMLGGRPFNLVLDSHSLAIHYEATDLLPSSTSALWIAPRFTPAKRALLAQLSPAAPQVPISKFGQRSSLSQINITVPLTLRTPIQPPQLTLQVNSGKPRTLAQELLESDHDDEDELFAMISTSATGIISPTPTKERFSLPQLKPIRIPTHYTSFSPLSSPEPSSSSESSRPSSRSSTFSSTFSDDESMTSASSIASSRFLPQPKVASLPRGSVMRRQVPTEPPVFIDNTKKNSTRYLYQGGSSSTLGGGVMLGRPTAAAPSGPKPAPASIPKYRAPVGGKNAGANAASWRRTPQPSRRV